MHKISVIVPIYKTGKILTRTLNSIKNQSFVNFECILIDDGSADKETFLICQKFVTEDSRFNYYEKINEGIEKTRVFGVKKSKTSLLVFCDHDDYYGSQALKLLYDAWIISKADIIVANCYFQLFKKIPIKKKNYDINNNFVLHRNEFMEKYYKNFFGINVFPVSTWGKLYSKHLFNEELKCFGYNFFEDTVLNVQLFARVSKVHFIPQYIYTHIYGGLSSKFDVKSAFNGYTEIYEFRNNLLKKNNLYDKLNKYLLIEFKNVVNQYIVLMIENEYNKKDFINSMNIIYRSTVLQDTLNADFEKGRYFEFISNAKYGDLYDCLVAEYTMKKIFKVKVKMLIKTFLS